MKMIITCCFIFLLSSCGNVTSQPETIKNYIPYHAPKNQVNKESNEVIKRIQENIKNMKNKTHELQEEIRKEQVDKENLD